MSEGRNDGGICLLWRCCFGYDVEEEEEELRQAS